MFNPFHVLPFQMERFITYKRDLNKRLFVFFLLI